MSSFTPSVPARRASRLAGRRARRRPVSIAAGLSLGIVAAAACTATVPAARAEASAPPFALASFSTTQQQASTTTAGTDDVAAGARNALATAETALAAAAAVMNDIAASGLDIGVPDTSIDTTGLETAVDRLELAGSVPPPLVPFLTDNVTAQVAAIDARVAGLRGSLDAAKALKAEQEAAELARIEAEAAAAAAAAVASDSDAGSAGAPIYATGGGGSGDNSPGGAQASARAMLGDYGWGDDQFGCLVSLWDRESGWNYQAHNSSSGAHGIPQALPGSKMASAGADWQTNAATQVAWGLGYISGRYGSPCGAWDHSESSGWY